MKHSLLTEHLRRQNLTTYSLLLVLAGLSWWLAELFPFERQTDDGSRLAPKHSADYFSTGYLRKDLNAQGLLKTELAAQTILHYSDDGTTHIEKPMLTLYNSDPQIPPWVVKSDKGILSADGEQLLLAGKVFIDRAKAPGVMPLSIRTTNLHVQPKNSYAQTADWAELVSPPHRTEGQGLKMTFKKPIHIQLLSKVKTRYVPN